MHSLVKCTRRNFITNMAVFRQSSADHDRGVNPRTNIRRQKPDMTTHHETNISRLVGDDHSACPNRPHRAPSSPLPTPRAPPANGNTGSRAGRHPCTAAHLRIARQQNSGARETPVRQGRPPARPRKRLGRIHTAQCGRSGAPVSRSSPERVVTRPPRVGGTHRETCRPAAPRGMARLRRAPRTPRRRVDHHRGTAARQPRRSTLGLRAKRYSRLGSRSAHPRRAFGGDAATVRCLVGRDAYSAW
ncbi:hypothetical protein F4559_002895 [Saccharothrix violaceirubra]|uniref:Uncharacterized protein n=1 Tax=Saccharothrix violaceirubra TaxID=413306 RepID=A0A7W7WVX6_9PSEU|nr:hypothetical protein [Saccharothrix violaceirubra]